MSGHGFIKLNRESEILLETDPDAFLLMCQIAFRAKWKDHKLDMRTTKLGEALIGDFESCGLTRQRYRSAQRRLSDRKISTFKTTNKGTIAKLLDNSFCDLNLEIVNHPNNHPTNQQITIQQPTSNQQITTNKEVKKERSEEEKTAASAASAAPDSAAAFLDPDKAKHMLLEFFKSQNLTAEEQNKQFKRSIPRMYLALQFISQPGFIINKTPMHAFVWAFNAEPWLEEGNQPKKLTNRERVEKHFVDGELYNGAKCAINAKGISFHRGINTGGAKFDDKTFMASLSNALTQFSIENPFQKTISIKEA